MVIFLWRLFVILLGPQPLKGRFIEIFATLSLFFYLPLKGYADWYDHHFLYIGGKLEINGALVVAAFLAALVLAALAVAGLVWALGREPDETRPKWQKIALDYVSPPLILVGLFTIIVPGDFMILAYQVIESFLSNLAYQFIALFLVVFIACGLAVLGDFLINERYCPSKDSNGWWWRHHR